MVTDAPKFLGFQMPPTNIYQTWSSLRLQMHKNLTAWSHSHYGDVIMGAMASQITSLTIVYSTVHSDADQRKHQSSASLAFVWGSHRGPVNSPHKWPVTREMFPFDNVIMTCAVPTIKLEIIFNHWRFTSQWRHDECDGVSNQRHLECLVDRLFRRRSKKTSQLRVTALCEGNPQVANGFPHKWPVTRKMFPFDDVIMSKPTETCA